jgi:sporulation protein YlmC with PRC-barrel domain
MEPFWTWGGTFFGFRREDSLFTHDGVEAGRFYEDEIYGADGKYLGEIRNTNRLITDARKKERHKQGFSPRHTVGVVPYVDYVGYVMYVGFEDFPSPKQFK